MIQAQPPGRSTAPPIRCAIKFASRAVTGPAFWSKAVLQRLLRDTPWVKRENKARRRPEFRLDPDRPGAIVDLEPA